MTQFPTEDGKEAGQWSPTGLGDGTHRVSGPRRVFKLAVSEEVESFKGSGKIESDLDKQDGFVHLSDYTSARVVAKLFFTKATDLQLVEIDASKFPAPVQWVVGKMGDPQPAPEVLAAAKTTIHYLRADGCVHVYGDAGVSTATIVREAPVPLGADGTHVFPAWLNSQP